MELPLQDQEKNSLPWLFRAAPPFCYCFVAHFLPCLNAAHVELY